MIGNRLRDVVLMNSAFFSSGSFGYIVRLTCIGCIKYTGRSINLRSEPTPIHGPVNKYEFNFS